MYQEKYYWMNIENCQNSPEQVSKEEKQFIIK